MVSCFFSRLSIIATLALTVWVPSWSTSLIIKNAHTEVYFSPNGGCQDAVVNTIKHARKSILVQAYSFTSSQIADALKWAHNTGVNVTVILDRSQINGRYSGLTRLQQAGIPVWLDCHHAIAHNKVIVIDGEIVITGSFNFTKAAEKSNAENVIIINDIQLARLYTDNWQSHRKHSELLSSAH